MRCSLRNVPAGSLPPADLAVITAAEPAAATVLITGDRHGPRYIYRAMIRRPDGHIWSGSAPDSPLAAFLRAIREWEGVR